MAQAIKIAASACANDVGFQENPMAATRKHATASHRATSRAERDQQRSIFMFSVAIRADLRARAGGNLGHSGCNVDVVAAAYRGPTGRRSALNTLSVWKSRQGRRAQSLYCAIPATGRPTPSIEAGLRNGAIKR